MDIRNANHGWQRPRVLAGACAAALIASLLPGQASAVQPEITMVTDQVTYFGAEGGSARVGVTVSTPDGQALASAVWIDYATGAGSAVAGADYTPVTGQLTFAAGTASGSTKWFEIPLRRDGQIETAETIPLTFSPAIAKPATVVINANGMAYLNSRLPVEWRVSDLMRRMTLQEKIGQMTQAERGMVFDNPDLIEQWMLGSVLSGGGSTPPTNTPEAWVAMVNRFQAEALSTRLQIPMIYGIDAVHGHGNVYGATIFPHNVGLGSTRDPKLLEQIGEATAAEIRATGIPWNFSPCVCISRDERWGRTYESFGEDPSVAIKLESIIDGMQGRLGEPDRVLATAKHYAGDGDTKFDTAAAEFNVGRPWYEQRYTIDQGITVTNRQDFARLSLSPYAPAIKENRVGSVMPSFSSVDWTEDGVGNPTKMHANGELITGQLKDRSRFRGFVISDWEGIHQIPDPAEPTNGGLTPYKVRVGVNAGTDMFMEPNTAKQFEDLLLAEVQAGRVRQSRIDDAVSRILRKKFELGLFERPFAPTDKVGEVGSAAHRALAREAVAKSQVLLKNSGGLLPLSRNAHLYVAGRNADDIGNQSGGWTIQWQGVSGDAVPGTTILEGIRQVAPGATVTYSADASAPISAGDIGVVVVGETPYSEGFGDVSGPECGFCTPAQLEEKSLSLQAGDKAVIDRVCGAVSKCVVLVVSGRPQVLTDQIGQIDALVASWLPGSEGAGVADVLFGKRPFTGRLSMTWPRSVAQVPINVGDASYDPLFPFGWGLRTGHRAAGDEARDAAEQAVLDGRARDGWAKLFAEADRASLNNDPATAVTLLARVAGKE